VKCSNYDAAEVKRAVEEAISLIGGLNDVVKSGDRIGIKPNLTTNHSGEAGVTTHPAVVSALIDCFRKITSGKITIMEGAGGANTADAFKDQGWVELSKNKNCRLVDLNHPVPYPTFVVCRIPGGGLAFRELTFNRAFKDIDVFVSVAKLKVHELAGITLTVKNQFGSVPMDAYGNMERAKWQLHKDDPWRSMPCAINDINACNPINLAVVDGVIGLEGGAGLWNPAARAKNTGLIIIGKNAVAVDAVGTVLMGYDPEADYPDPPFEAAENHLRIARDLGLGPTDLKKIDIRLGKGIRKLSDAASPFSISYSRADIPAEFKLEKVSRLKP